MLYYLFTYLDKQFDLIGAGVFQYISFRAGAAAVLSLLITITFGKRLINYLSRKQVGESIRDLGLEGQMQKKGTPTMGGIIIIAAILIPTLLLAKLDNVYIVLLITATIGLGLIGNAIGVAISESAIVTSDVAAAEEIQSEQPTTKPM